MSRFRITDPLPSPEPHLEYAFTVSSMKDVHDYVRCYAHVGIDHRFLEDSIEPVGRCWHFYQEA